MASNDSTPDPLKSSQASNAIRDLSGKFAKVDPPLVSFSITNPVTYIRKWWKGVMSGEGIDLKLKIHPMTAVMIVCAVSGVSFGVGRLSVPEPLLQYIPILATPKPATSPDPWVESTKAGILQKLGVQYVLIGRDTQVITLENAGSTDLAALTGKRVLVSGQFNPLTQILRLTQSSKIEVISGTLPPASVLPSPAASSSAELSP